MVVKVKLEVSQLAFPILLIDPLERETDRERERERKREREREREGEKKMGKREKER